MAGSTIMTAKNSFSEGLLMDFSPDNTQANCMTSALNATLLTFNGNEMSLQNDMGNGRVETAYLPDGYIPVGTCEFGDIIYIISYNPILDKALIGCFPSPERNISSEELINAPLEETLKSSDFLEMKNENGIEKPTGKLRTTSVKKILFLNNLHPGDKYIIASSEIVNSIKTISAYGSKDYNMDDFPKFVKIHVVSVEESGKINYLDSSVKWYDNLIDGVKTPYFISNSVSPNKDKIDIDSYRDLVSSGYSVFNSKTSGQLALLIELEKITGFNCTWECFEVSSERDKEIGREVDSEVSTLVPVNIIYTNYDVYLNFNWTTNNNDINISHVLLEDCKWLNEPTVMTWQYVDDNKGKYKKQNVEIGPVDLPTITTEIALSRHYIPEAKDLTYDKYKENSYEEYLKKFQEYDTIEREYKTNKNNKTFPSENNYLLNNTGPFNSITSNLKDSIINNKFKYPITKKIGTFKIPTHTILTYDQDVTDNENTSVGSNKVTETISNNLENLKFQYKAIPTMPYGKLEEFAQEGYIDFSKIGKEYIDLTTWKYYNYENTSTLTWGFEAYTKENERISDIEFEFYDNDTGSVAKMSHANYNSYNGQFTDYLVFDTEYGNGNVLPGNRSNSGILESNKLYLVKITVTVKSILGNKLETSKPVFYRWFWTNDMFNLYYSTIKDFDLILITLNLDANVKFKLTDKWKSTQTVNDNVRQEPISGVNIYRNLSATILEIGQADEQNISAEVEIFLNNNSFELSNYNNITKEVYLGNQSLLNYPEVPKVIYSTDEVSTANNYVQPLLDTNFSGKNIISTSLNSESTSYQLFKNTATLTLNGTNPNSKSKTYCNELGQKITVNSKVLNDINNITLNFKAQHYSKYCSTNTSSILKIPVLRSFLYDKNDLNSYNLREHIISSTSEYKKLWFDKIYTQSVTLYDHKNDTDKPAYEAFVFSFKPDEELKEYNLYIRTIDNPRGGGVGLGYSEPNKRPYKDVWNGKHKSDSDQYNIGQNEFKENINNFIFPFAFVTDARRDVNGNAVDTKWEARIDNNTLTNYPESVLTSLFGVDNQLYSLAMGFYCDDDIFINNTNNRYREPENIDTSANIKDSKSNMVRYFNEYLALLTQLYYISDESSDSNDTVYIRDNYITLESNYTEYSRDFVLELTAKGDLSNQIKLKKENLNLSTYVDKVKNNVKVNGKLPENISSYNHTIVCGNVIKCFPLKVNMYYISPKQTFDLYENNSTVIKTSKKKYFKDGSLKEIPNTYNGRFNLGLIYAWDSKNEQFVPITNVETLEADCLLYTTENNAIVFDYVKTTDRTYKTDANLNQICNYLTISNGKLAFSNLPNVNKTQEVITSKEYDNGFVVSSIGGLRLTEFPTDRYYFSN